MEIKVFVLLIWLVTSNGNVSNFTSISYSDLKSCQAAGENSKANLKSPTSGWSSNQNNITYTCVPFTAPNSAGK